MKFNKVIKSIVSQMDYCDGKDAYILINLETVNGRSSKILFGLTATLEDMFILAVNEEIDSTAIKTFLKNTSSSWFLNSEFYKGIMLYLLDSEDSGNFVTVKDVNVLSRKTNTVTKLFGFDVYKYSGLRNMRPYVKFYSLEDGGYGFKDNIQPRVSGKKQSNQDKESKNCKENTQRKAKIG